MRSSWLSQRRRWIPSASPGPSPVTTLAKYDEEERRRGYSQMGRPRSWAQRRKTHSSFPTQTLCMIERFAMIGKRTACCRFAGCYPGPKTRATTDCCEETRKKAGADQHPYCFVSSFLFHVYFDLPVPSPSPLTPTSLQE